MLLHYWLWYWNIGATQLELPRVRYSEEDELENRVVSTKTGTPVAESEIEKLSETLHGQLIRAGDDAYEASRKVWNGMIDRFPGLIARCTGVTDVITAVNFARNNNLLVAIRGGGHSIPGHSVCDGGLVIDLSPMKGIWVDPQRSVARAQAGVTWAELDRETETFGLVTPGGVISTTGIAGLTLGGGVGWLVRKYGLSCDNLVSVDLVTANGEPITASESENEDLFWALRGGGGNFGVGTSFEYRLHPHGPVTGGLVIHPREKAKDVLRFYRDFMGSAPDELTAYAAFVTTPDGMPAVAILGCYSGPPAGGEATMRPLKEFGPPMADLIGLIPHTQMQSLLDAGFPRGNHNYWRATYIKELSEELFDVLIDYANKAPSPLTAIIIEHYGGAASRVSETATAFPHRRLTYDLNIVAQWQPGMDEEANLKWVDEISEAVKPFAADGVYLNFLGDEGEGKVRAAFGGNYDRLVEIKTKYDPTNMFSLNQNVRPSS